MGRLWGYFAADCRVVLRALAPIEHAVVANDTDNPMTRLIGAGVSGRRESLGSGPIPPRGQERQFSFVVDAGEHVVIDQVRLSGLSRSRSGRSVAPTPVCGRTSVSVMNFARPISVSSSRCSTSDAPAGGAVSATISPTRRW